MKYGLNAQPNQSLIDGIATLQALATSPEPVGGRELARQLGLDATRVNRLLKTLAYVGIARQTADRKYAPGPGMHVLAAQSLFASGLVRRALPGFEGLRKFGQTVALGVLWERTVSYLIHAPPGVDVAHALGRIGLLPATTSGIGIVLLSEYDDDDVRALYKDLEIPAFPDGIEQLLEKLAEVRRLGYVRARVPDDRDFHVIAVSTGNPAHAGLAVSGWIPEASTGPIVEALHAVAKELGE